MQNTENEKIQFRNIKKCSVGNAKSKQASKNKHNIIKSYLNTMAAKHATNLNNTMQMRTKHEAKHLNTAPYRPPIFLNKTS